MRRPLFALLCLAAAATAGPAHAWDETPRLYAVSDAPYWDVGEHDVELSRLCRAGRFNQKNVARLYIQYTGAEGRGITGVATQGWNLIDRDGRAEAGATYHFHADGTTACNVYVAREGGGGGAGN